MSRGEKDIIYIGSQEFPLNGNIKKTLGQVKDAGLLPDTENLLERFENYRFFSEDRVIRAKHGARGYGGTEILVAGLKARLLDAVVLVCDGVGTIITTDPEIVYGIGNEQPLIKDTRRIDGLVERLINEGVRILERPGIDQIAGIERAFELGYRHVGLTLTDGPDGEIEKYGQYYLDHHNGLGNNRDNMIYAVCYYPPILADYMDLAFTTEEIPDLWKGRKRLRKAYLNVMTDKGKELVEAYKTDRFAIRV